MTLKPCSASCHWSGVGPLEVVKPAAPEEKATEPFPPETSSLLDDRILKPLTTITPSSELKELIVPAEPASPDASSQVVRPPWKINFILLLILLIGAYFRLTGLNWDDNSHQHPDERFVTMVAEQIRGVDGIGAYFDTANSTLNPLKFGSYTYGMFPLFATRLVAEWGKMTEYDIHRFGGAGPCRGFLIWLPSGCSTFLESAYITNVSARWQQHWLPQPFYRSSFRITLAVDSFVHGVCGCQYLFCHPGSSH